MALILNEEQQMLKTSAAEFLKSKAPIASLRLLRDTNDPTGYDKELWREMAEMGWACLTIPETYGGLDFGYTGLGQILEETGRTLTASPLVSTVLLSTTAITLSANESLKQALLPAIAEGNLVVALAFEEGKFHKTDSFQTTATTNDDGYSINGIKTFVLDGHVADTFIVATNNGLFVVDANADGVSRERIVMMDSRNAAVVSFDNVNVSASAKLGDNAILNKTLDIGRIGLAAEMLGSIKEAFERTMAYLKERQQFGVTIGSFQALQHRAAIMFGEIELCKSIVIKALQAIDEDSEDLPRLASLAKAKLGQTFQLVSNEGIQMHGGIGMTDEEEIGFFLKRARVAQRTFGDSNYHLDRLAKMKGY